MSTGTTRPSAPQPSHMQLGPAGIPGGSRLLSPAGGRLGGLSGQPWALGPARSSCCPSLSQRALGCSTQQLHTHNQLPSPAGSGAEARASPLAPGAGLQVAGAAGSRPGQALAQVVGVGLCVGGAEHQPGLITCVGTHSLCDPFHVPQFIPTVCSNPWVGHHHLHPTCR